MNAEPSQASFSAKSQGGRHRTGLFTLLFTDVVGSTQLKAELGDQSGVTLIQSHHALVREVLRSFPDAEEISTAGDSFLLVFTKPSDALRFALQLQHRLRVFNEGRPAAVQDRVGLHMGEVVIEEHAGKRDVHGMQVDTCARVMSLAQAGQVLMTRPVFDNARQSLKGEELEGISGLEWLNHGRFELKGLDEPVEVCEVRAAGTASFSPPTTSEKARRVESAEGEAVLGWRPAVGTAVPNTQWMLQEKLGEGGFGEVWLGRHQTMKERRVFKFCFRADRVRSLKREMTLFRLIKERIGDHPNIVALREVYFEHPPYYVEEDYTAGRDLGGWCAAQGGLEKVPLKTKLELVAQIADALQAAHDSGVIHRDVKPGNILVASSEAGRAVPSAPSGPEGRGCASGSLGTASPTLKAKLTDFGIGQVISEEALAGVTRAGFTQTMLSSSSSQTGTQMYMAPELLAGKPASIRSDIYSLGVVLYQLLVSDFSQPVTGDWAADIEDGLLREDLRHCLAGRPGERFTGAGQLALSLRAWEQRKVEAARRRAEQAEREHLRHKAEHRRRLLLVSGTVAAVLMALAIALGYGMRKAQLERERHRKLAYAADMNLAQQAVNLNNVGRARRLLDRHRPEPGQQDLRGWEWRYLWQLTRSSALVTLTNRQVNGFSVSFSPDGTRLAVGWFDGRVDLWDVPARRHLRALTGREHPHQGRVAFSPVRNLLAATSEPRTVTLYDLDSGKESILWRAPAQGRWNVHDLAFSKDGSRVAIYASDPAATSDAVSVVSVSSSQPESRYPTVWCDSFHHGAARLSADGKRLYLSRSDSRNNQYSIRCIDVVTGNELWETERLREYGLTALDISPDGRFLASGSGFEDPTIRVWDAATGRPVNRLHGHTGWVCKLAFSSDGRRLISAASDQSIRFWGTNTWTETAVLRGHSDEVYAVAVSELAQLVASAGKDGDIKLWQGSGTSAADGYTRLSADVGGRFLAFDQKNLLWLSSTNPPQWVNPPDTAGCALAGVKSSSDVFVVRGTNLLCHWDGTNSIIVSEFLGTNFAERHAVSVGARSRPDAVAYCPKRHLLAWASPSSATNISLASVDSLGRRLELKGDCPGLIPVSFSDDGNYLLAQTRQKNALRALDVKTGRVVASLDGPFVDAGFAARDTVLVTLVSGWNDHEVRFYHLAEPTREPRRVPGRFNARQVAVSPDGALVAIPTDGGQVRLFDPQQGKLLSVLHGHLNAAFSLAFSPDGSRLISSSGAREAVKLWDVTTLQELLTLSGGGSFVRPTTWSPDGQLILAGRPWQVWRAPSWEEISTAEAAIKDWTMP